MCMLTSRARREHQLPQVLKYGDECAVHCAASACTVHACHRCLRVRQDVAEGLPFSMPLQMACMVARRAECQQPHAVRPALRRALQAFAREGQCIRRSGGASHGGANPTHVRCPQCSSVLSPPPHAPRPTEKGGRHAPRQAVPTWSSQSWRCREGPRMGSDRCSRSGAPTRGGGPGSRRRTWRCSRWRILPPPR